MWRELKCEEMPQKRVWKGSERERRHIMGSGAEAEVGRVSPNGGKKRLKALKKWALVLLSDKDNVKSLGENQVHLRRRGSANMGQCR